ncbi:hypothetical protein [Palleronia pelagia]|nr:hypothetical protein [Palleronia pelagia]
MASLVDGHAQTASDNEIEEFAISNEREFLSNFIAAAVSNQSNQYRIPPFNQRTEEFEGIFNITLLRSFYPWLTKHLHEVDGRPKLQAINKWSKPIRISFAPPADENLCSEVNQNRTTDCILWPVTSQKDHEDIKAEVSELIGSLASLTGLDISLASNVSDPANLHILRIPSEGQVFKKNKSIITTISSSTFPKPILFAGYLDRFLPNAVWFTAGAKRHVEGFYLPDSRNRIDRAFCYIRGHHSVEIIRAMTRECLLRSLGLPGALSNSPPMGQILSLWNENADITDVDLPVELGVLDREIIKHLYSEKIYAGMTPWELQVRIRKIKLDILENE